MGGLQKNSRNEPYPHELPAYQKQYSIDIYIKDHNISYKVLNDTIELKEKKMLCEIREKGNFHLGWCQGSLVGEYL